MKMPSLAPRKWIFWACFVALWVWLCYWTEFGGLLGENKPNFTEDSHAISQRIQNASAARLVITAYKSIMMTIYFAWSTFVCGVIALIKTIFFALLISIPIDALDKKNMRMLKEVVYHT